MGPSIPLLSAVAICFAYLHFYLFRVPLPTLSVRQLGTGQSVTGYYGVCPCALCFSLALFSKRGLSWLTGSNYLQKVIPKRRLEIVVVASAERHVSRSRKHSPANKSPARLQTALVFGRKLMEEQNPCTLAGRGMKGPKRSERFFFVVVFFKRP